MAITILPRSKAWGETLGEGFGALAQGLLEGKAAQMQRRYDYDTYQRAGLNPNYALMPKEFGLEALRSSNKATQRQQAAQEQEARDLTAFNAYAQEAARQGVSAQTIKNARAAGPAKGLELLNKGMVSLDKSRPAETALQWWSGQGLNRSKYAASRNEKAGAILDELYPVGETPQAAPKTAEQRQAEEQQAYNEQYYLNPEQKTNSSIDRMNQAASQIVSQQNAEQNPLPTKREMQVQMLMQDPRLTDDQKQEILDDLDEISPVEKTALDIPMKVAQGEGLLPYLTSGAVGLGKTALALSPPFAGQTLAQFGLGAAGLGSQLLFGENYVPSYEDLQKNLAQAAQPDERTRQAIEEGRKSDSFLARAGAEEMADMGGATLPPTADQVTNTIQQFAAGTPLEKYVIPQSRGQAKAELIGGLMGAMNKGAFKAAGSLTGKAKEGLKLASKAFGARSVGDITEVLTGSKALGDAVTLGSVFYSNMSPGSFKDNYEREYAKYDKEITDNPRARNIKINLNNYNEQLDKIERSAKNYAPTSPERKQFDSQIMKLKHLAEEAGKEGVDPVALRKNIQSTQDAARSAKPTVKKDINRLANFQKEILVDHANKVSPTAAAALQEGDAIYRSFKASEKVAKDIAEKIFPKQLSAGTAAFIMGAKMPAILGAAYAYKGGKAIQLLLSNPSVRETMKDLIKASATENARAVNLLAKKLEKKMYKAEPEFMDFVEQFRGVQPGL